MADRALSELRPHPENATIFLDPEECDQYDALFASIKKLGILEPLGVKEDGTILSGHIRFHIARALKLKTVPTYTVPRLPSYRDEVELLIRCNTDRRQLSKVEVALAFKRLKELPREDGGAAKKRGRPEGSVGGANKVRPAAPEQRADKRSDAKAAEILGVGEKEARALETVFTTPGVPDELKRAVNKGTVAPTPAAKAVRTELKRQGGEIKDASALEVIAKRDIKPDNMQKPEPSHAERVAANAAAYERDYRDLFEVYKRLDGILSRRPLKSVIGPTEHHQYTSLIRDTAMRAWREIESVNGPSETGKQMSLTVVPGGKS